MATRKVKHARMMEKRAKWESDYRESGLANLKAAQRQRAEEKRQEEEKSKQRKIATSKKLAAKNAAKTASPSGNHNSPTRKKSYNKARQGKKEI